MSKRSISRIDTLAPPAPGGIGRGHTAVKVVQPTALDSSDPFVLLVDDRFRLRSASSNRRGASSNDDASYITVTNSGPLVPESAVVSMFEPFMRLEGRASNGEGVGLGLSIVTSVVNAHHGDLLAVALPNGGMNISVRLSKATVGSSLT